MRIRTRCFALMRCLPGIDGWHCRGGGIRAASALRRTAAGRYETAETRDRRRRHWSRSALQEMLCQLDETGAGGRAGHIPGRRGEPPLESADVRDTDRVAEEGEHGGVVLRIADEYELPVRSVEIEAKALAEQDAAGRELVVAAEPAVHVNRADLGVQPRVAHQLRNPLRGVERERRHVFAVVDREVGLAVRLIGGERAAGHLGEDAPGDAVQAGAFWPPPRCGFGK